MDLTQSPLAPARRRLFGRNGWVAIALILPLLWVGAGQGGLFPLYQFKTQDQAVLVGLVAMLLVTDQWAPRWRLPAKQPAFWQVVLAGAGLALALWWGCYALLGNYPISRDEHMVAFDMAVFAHGHLAEPVAQQWRPYAVDLVPAFLLNPDMPIGFVSAYLPGNAVLRLLFSYVADPALMNPLLALCGGLALFDIARRLFGADSRAIWVTLLVYALSTQMAVNAMTTYAMTGHMAFNLIWLAAFLRGGRWGHAVAIAVGFIATGLHQIVFHPLFIAPFLLWRLREGHWRLVIAYGAAYCAIVAWWAAYPLLAALQTGVGTHAGGSQESFFADRVWPLLAQRDPFTIPLMTLNLLRFAAWQNLALLPLLVAAAPLALKSRSIVAPLFWGVVGAIFFLAFILPFQGHGWGYRYLNGYLGSFALLAGFGYQRLAGEKGRAADGMVLLLAAVTLLGAMPYLMSRAQAFVAPHVALERLLDRQQGDFLLIDTDGVGNPTDGAWGVNAIDLARNLPDLSNRPLRFSSRSMERGAIAELCKRGTVSFVSRADMHRVGFALNSPVDNERLDRIAEQVRAIDPGCLRAAHVAVGR